AQIAQARQSGAQLVLFPELVLSGYPPEDLVLRQDFLVAARAQLERVASHCTDVVAFVGYPMAHADGVANALAVLAGGEVVMSYRKRLLPNYGVFDEQRYFISGDEDGLVLIGDVLVGISVCEDAWADEPV